MFGQQGVNGTRPPFFELQKQPPPKKGRNLKNLAVNTSRQPGKAASTSSLQLPAQVDVAASVLSPAFVKPPTPPRKKPNNLGLTILTPENNAAPPQEVRLTIPETPGFGRPSTLRHFQSSPSLPLMSHFGMANSLARDLSQQRTLETILSPVERPNTLPVDDDDRNFDIPLSQEEKPEAYPDGPICVYEPGIDLYLEPTLEQAQKYDVILNVASEVRNPFVMHVEPTPAEPDIRLDGGGGIQYAPKRERTLAEINLNRDLSSHDASPTTPKATPMAATFPLGVQSEGSMESPEYIHIQWEHNSDIVPDLPRLVKLLEDRVMEGKRVLVHCQCGVSRSASLVVAYGLYKNPSMTVQEAYDAVKSKSKWIGPNMNLIMQLQEFRSNLASGQTGANRSSLSSLTPNPAFEGERQRPFSFHSPGLVSHEVPLSAAAAQPSHPTATNGLDAITPGPSSAPSGLAWPVAKPQMKKRARAISAVKPGSAYVDPSGHVVPVPKLSSAGPAFLKLKPLAIPRSNQSRPQPSLKEEVSSPRATEFAMAPLHVPPTSDSADSFGIMSPTSTEFALNPFDRSALLATLGMGTMRKDEETPRRSLSVRSSSRDFQRTQPSSSQLLHPEPRRNPLRAKISAPSLREQRQLQNLQAQIEASLPLRHPPASTLGPIDDALMSPRATEFTNNPFAMTLSVVPEPSTAAAPVQDESTRSANVDPRSPAHKGASPITRNILDVL